MHRAFWRKVGLYLTDGHKSLAAHLIRGLGRGVKLGMDACLLLGNCPLKMLASELGRTEPVLGAGSSAPSLRLNLGEDQSYEM